MGLGSSAKSWSQRDRRKELEVWGWDVSFSLGTG